MLKQWLCIACLAGLLARPGSGWAAGAQAKTHTMTFLSVGAYDGWILESGEFSNQGGTLDKTGAALLVGDDARDRQYRSFLSFNTAGLPDDAVISAAQVRVKRAGLSGSDPGKTHGDLLLEIRKGTFSNRISLELGDFAAAANVGSTLDVFSAAVQGWQSANLGSENLKLLNKTAETQFRLRFRRDDNDDLGMDALKLVSGNAAVDAARLVVSYTIPANQPPVITSNAGGEAAEIAVPENQMAVTQVTASDAPGSVITYSILGQDAGLFSMDPLGGTLRFRTAPDYEALPPGRQFQVTAQASDGALVDRQALTVRVTPVNEFAPVISSNGGGEMAEILLAEGQTAVTQVIASDADLPAQVLAYSLAGGTDAGRLQLDAVTGMLAFLAPPSYFAPDDANGDHVYEVGVQVSDGILTDRQQLRIRLVNPLPQPGFEVLHHFGSRPDNGRVPYGALVWHEGVLYGTTTYGGAPYTELPSNPANKGNLFRLNLDGTGFQVLHEFSGGQADGWKPWSGLALVNGRIVGSTVYGGQFGELGGTLYQLDLSGANFQLLHTFGAAGDGIGASTSPILAGGVLFGLTRWGGAGNGTIYRYDPADGDYRVLHRFAADGHEGKYPLGTLTPVGTEYLYGLAWQGGKNNFGTLFRVRADGSGFEVLHHFAGGTGGKYPYDSLAYDGGDWLYGTTLGTYGNDSSDLGTVFRYQLSTGAHQVLHRFSGGAHDSAKPNGSVVLTADGLTLYGTTHGTDAWGGSECGALYRMGNDGAGYALLHEFCGGAAGATPMRTPLLIQGGLYGMTAYGGVENYGTIYRFQLSEMPLSGLVMDAATFDAHVPQFVSPAAVTSAETQRSVMLLQAQDVSLPAETLRYSLGGGADMGRFVVDAASGALDWADAPDFEQPLDAGRDGVYEVTVQASDGILTGSQDLRVTVADVNEAPVFQTPGAVAIPENNRQVLQVHALDPDRGTASVRYRLLGSSDSSLFSLDAESGELFFNQAPDYENPLDAGMDNHYTLTVGASDGVLESAQVLSIQVSDLNEPPIPTSSASLSTVEGGTGGWALYALDPDRPMQALVWRILSGADAALFQVQAQPPRLDFSKAPDYEKPADVGRDNQYQLTLEVSDGLLRAVQTVQVQVLPVNDLPPVFHSSDTPVMMENGWDVLQVAASDPDRPAASLTYAISGGADRGFFSLNPLTGALAFLYRAPAPDFESPQDANRDNVYEVSVQVWDGFFNSEQVIRVEVKDVEPEAVP